MKRYCIALLCVIGASCSGSPAAPSAPQVSAAPPVAAPAIVSMVGGWTGTLAISVVGHASNTCALTWIISTQVGAVFSGTYQLSGGTVVACAEFGTVTGTISAATISNVQMQGPSGLCVRVGGDGLFAGAASSLSITAQRSDRVACGSVTEDRTLSMLLTKR